DDVHRDSALVVDESVQREHLVRELLDRADAFLAMRPGVCGAARDRQPEAAQALARGLQVAARSRRLDDEGGSAAARLALEVRPSSPAAHLLVGRKEDTEGSCSPGREANCLDEQ